MLLMEMSMLVVICYYLGTTHGQWLKTSIYTFVQLQIFNDL